MDQSNVPVPGKNQAVASLVLGIVSVVFWFFGITTILSLIMGIVGLVLASMSKKSGFVGGIRTAGFVLSLIGTIGGALFFVTCVLCVGCLAAIGEAAYTL